MLNRAASKQQRFFIALVVGTMVVCSMLGAEESSAGKPDRVDGYRGIWFTLGQFSAHGDKYSGGLGTYTANHVPMAVYSPEAKKTFFTYGGTPAEGERHLLIMASYYDHVTNQIPRPVIVCDKQGVDDPHDNGSINIDADGYLWVFVSGRAKKRPGLIYKSSQPYSIDSFEHEMTSEFTYPQPWYLRGKGFFLLFTKYTNGRELYWKTRSDGGKWTTDQKLAGFGGHYQVSGEHNGKIATFFNYHPGGVVDKRTNLYYAQTTDFGRTWTTAAGKRLSVPLAGVQNPALVFDLQSEGRLMYTCDLNFDDKGNPILLYVTSRNAEPGPEGNPRLLTVAHWTGGEWKSYAIAETGHNYDMGSLYVSGSEWRVIAPTKERPQKYQTGGEIALWVSMDEGKTWKMERQITRGSEANHGYVRRPLNATNPFFAYWADGDPTKLSQSRLYFTDSEGDHVWKLPYDMTEESVQPVEVTKP